VKRRIDDVAGTLRMAQARNKRCTLLIGAGCSVTAGIPPASGIMAYIREHYYADYERAEEKTYALTMAELAVGERRDLIADYVDKAKLNWAHICIAQLMKSGYVDRILTTNFDPLVIQACALVGLFPAVYDFAASQTFKAGDIPQQAVVYLHGQRSGFVLLNTQKEVTRHSELLKPVFEEAGQGRVWLVVGYSGESDPVFDRLADDFSQFENRLYWVGYPESDPPRHVRKRLLQEGKGAFYVDGYDADSFFVNLLQQLDAFPPDFVGRPFSYLEQLMESLSPYKPGAVNGPDPTARARGMILDAIEQYESGAIAETERRAQDLLLAGKFAELEQMQPEEPDLAPEVASSVAWARVLEGNDLGDSALTASGPAADSLFEGAYEKYDEALKLSPDMHEALHAWGITLGDQAKTKEGAEADRLFAAAYEKYGAALERDPASDGVVHAWGNNLGDQAKTKEGAEADRLFAAAYEKYGEALELNPIAVGVLQAWGVTLADQAKTKEGAEADRLFAAAYEKYGEALERDPAAVGVLQAWGITLSDQAKTKEGSEADLLYAQAQEKYSVAVELKPDDPDKLNNWGLALSDQAKTKVGADADRLFEAAYEKYAAALELEREMHFALNNWGNALSDQAKTKEGAEADRLFEVAYEKYAEAVELEPDDPDNLNNWALALSDHANTKEGMEADRLFVAACEKYDAALELTPDDAEKLNSWGVTLLDQARIKEGAEADRLFGEAQQKFMSAEARVPGRSSYNLACVSALEGDSEEARRWLERSKELGHLPSPADLAEDTDLDSVRDEEWFAALVAESAVEAG